MPQSLRKRARASIEENGAEKSAPLSKRRSSIKDNIERSVMVDSKWDHSSTLLDDDDFFNPASSLRLLNDEIKEPFWDKRTVIFASWYWPSCIASGIMIGFLLTKTLFSA